MPTVRDFVAAAFVGSLVCDAFAAKAAGKIGMRRTQRSAQELLGHVRAHYEVSSGGLPSASAEVSPQGEVLMRSPKGQTN